MHSNSQSFHVPTSPPVFSSNLCNTNSRLESNFAEFSGNLLMLLCGYNRILAVNHYCCIANISVNIRSCVRPSLRLYFIAYKSFCSEFFLNSNFICWRISLRETDGAVRIVRRNALYSLRPSLLRMKSWSSPIDRIQKQSSTVIHRSWNWLMWVLQPVIFEGLMVST